SKEELLAVNLASGLIQDPGKRAQCVAEHFHHGLAHFEKFAVAVAATNSVAQITCQGAVTCFRMPQAVFGSVAFLAQCFLLQRPMNGYGKVANVLHFNTIVGASCNELC